MSLAVRRRDAGGVGERLEFSSTPNQQFRGVELSSSNSASDVERYLELAQRYLVEGRGLVDRDPVQASEKLYKAAEETVKALTSYFNLRDVLEAVEGRGRWTATDLSKAVRAISEKLGGWFTLSWDSAWALYVWGFHEVKLDVDDVRVRMPFVERMVLEARRIVEERRFKEPEHSHKI